MECYGSDVAQCGGMYPLKNYITTACVTNPATVECRHPSDQCPLVDLLLNPRQPSRCVPVQAAHNIYRACPIAIAAPPSGSCAEVLPIGRMALGEKGPVW